MIGSLGLAEPVPAVYLGVGDLFLDGAGCWDEIDSVEPVAIWVTADGIGDTVRNVATGEVRRAVYAWLTITTTSGYTWFIAADEEVETWLS